MEKQALITTHLPQFLSYVSGLAEVTRKTYGHGLAVFAGSGIPLDQNALKVFDEWLGKAKYERAGAKHNYSRETRGLYVAVLRKFLSWAEVEGLVDRNTVFNATERHKLSRSRSKRSARIVRTAPDDTNQIIGAFDTERENKSKDAPRMHVEWLRNRVLLHALWDSAGRVSELLQITRAQIADGKNAVVDVIGKGSKPRKLMFTPVTLSYIREYCAARQDTYPALFITHRRGKGASLSRIAAWNIVKRAQAVTGVTGMISPHIIRHARASQLVNEGMPMESVQIVLGHEDISTTQTYYAKLKFERVRDQMEEFGLQPGDMK